MKAPVLYRLLLRLLPPGFRRRHAADMAAMFEAVWRETRAPGRIRLASRAGVDVLASATVLWVASAREALAGGTTMTGGDMGRDVRHAVRGLARRPGFALAAVLTVALGVGASTGVFSVVDAAVFRALPYTEPDRLVSLGTWFEDMGAATFGLSDAEYLDYREEQESFSAIGAYALFEETWIPVDGEPVRLPVVSVYPGLLEVLDVRVRVGRLPARDEVEPGADPLVLLTHEAWRRRFAEDPARVGGTIRLGARGLRVVGVLEPGTRLPDGAPDAWMVWRRDRAAIADRSGHYLTGIGRLAPGAGIERVRAELDAVHARWHERFAGVHSPGHEGHRLTAAPLDEVVLGSSRGVASLLAAAAGLLLLLACVNVAGLLVARGEGRMGELGVRSALGAGRARLARQLLVESLVLAVAGGLVGWALAAWGVGALAAVDPAALPGLERVAPDGRMLGFALGVSLLTGLAFGLLPATRVPAAGAATLLRGAGRGGTRGPAPLLSALMVGQMALATVVVVAAGLLLRSRAALTSVDPGFSPAGAVVFGLELPGDRYRDRASIDAFWAGLEARLEAGPGVEDATVVRSLPLRSTPRREYVLREVPTGFDRETPLGVRVQAARPGYFETLGITVLEGRSFEPSDGEDALRVAVVSRAAARAYWPEGPLGQRFRATFDVSDAPPFTVVGVVADVRHEGLASAPEPEIYLPIAQVPAVGAGWVRRGTVVVRSASALAETAALARRVVRELEPTVAVEDLATLDQVVRGATARMRFLSLLIVAFAAAALVVAAVGVYGTVSFSVARRRREFGVRLALGAEPARLLGRVLGGGLRLAVAGAALGVAGALLLGPLLSGVLFEVSPRDGLAFAAGPAVLVLTAALACWLPARRASAVAPVESLREEG